MNAKEWFAVGLAVVVAGVIGVTVHEVVLPDGAPMMVRHGPNLTSSPTPVEPQVVQHGGE